jgi:hypothetical protein
VLVPLRLMAQGLTSSLLFFLMLLCPADATTMEINNHCMAGDAKLQSLNFSQISPFV